MKNRVYWNRQLAKFYDLVDEGVSLSQDPIDTSSYHLEAGQFLIHPLDIPIFLALSQIESNDEYVCGDPYQVAAGLDSAFHQRRIDLTAELVCSIIKPGFQILDLGCGEGFITAKLAEIAGYDAVYGLDYSLTAIIRAKTRFPALEFCVANAYEPPYPEHYFDMVVCNNLWEHLPDPVHFLDVVKSVLRAQGYLVLSTPSRFRLDNVINLMRRRQLHLMSPHHITEYTLGQVMEQLQHGGFETIRITSRSLEVPFGVKTFLRARIFRGLIGLGLELIKVPSISLESTVFYLAQGSKA
jgi:2-polyprenyl-3-methyl-5-hydroxy-6-metoxy-1,4-benzoquinol methylase